jgi:hypothetical protein
MTERVGNDEVRKVHVAFEATAGGALVGFGLPKLRGESIST